MSGMDGGRLLDDSGLSSAALTRNQPIINEVRSLLAAQDVAGFSALMAEFAEMVDDAGPLAYLRFESAAFDRQMQAYLSHAAPPNDPEAWCDAAHVAAIEALAHAAFLQHFRAELSRFLELTYPPRAHRRAVCAALLTTTPEPRAHSLQHQELPALYALFRAQLVAWLLTSGHPNTALAHIGSALSHD